MQPIYEVYMMLNVDRTLFLYKIDNLYSLPKITQRLKYKVTEKRSFYDQENTFHSVFTLTMPSIEETVY